MEYLKGEELQKLIKNFLKIEPIKVEVAIQKIVFHLNKLEKSYKNEIPEFDVSKALEFKSMGVNNIYPRFNNGYLLILGKEAARFKTTVKNYFKDSFNKRYLDFYTKDDLPN